MLRRLKHAYYIVPMVDRAFEILQLLETRQEGLIQQIHEGTGIAKSSAYRIVRTLVARGF